MWISSPGDLALTEMRPVRFSRQNGKKGIRRAPIIISAIRRKSVLQFNYNGKLRTVEPQTYGLSMTGREVLRACERTIPNASKGSGMAKLFDLNKISGLRKTDQSFRQALPA